MLCLPTAQLPQDWELFLFSYRDWDFGLFHCWELGSEPPPLQDPLHNLLYPTTEVHIKTLAPKYFFSDLFHSVIDFLLKGNLWSKTKAQMKEHENCKKKRAITDLIGPNGSRDNLFQSQEFEQYGRRHFVDF